MPRKTTVPVAQDKQAWAAVRPANVEREKIVMEPKRLSTTLVVVRDGDDYVSRYGVALVGGGSLMVCVPVALRHQDVLEVVRQLADLADSLEQEHGLVDREPSACDVLLGQAESLRKATTENLDLDEAHDVIASYARFREAVVEYLRITQRERPPDTM